MSKAKAHAFLVEDAEKYGLNAAAIMYHLRYLQDIKEAEGAIDEDGKCWVNSTYDAFSAKLPYLHVQAVRRALSKLVDAGAVEKKFNSKNRFDRELSWRVACVETDTRESKPTDVQPSKPTDVHLSKSPDVIHTINTNNTNSVHQDLFDTFWSYYPAKKNKKKSRDKFLSLSEKKMRLAVDDVKRRAGADEQWLRGFIPLPTTYLNGERWEDEWTATTTTGGHAMKGEKWDA